MLASTSVAKRRQGRVAANMPRQRGTSSSRDPVCRAQELANGSGAQQQRRVVFIPACKTAPAGRFTRVSRYENLYKKELPVGHWNSQFLDDPDSWWGEPAPEGNDGGNLGGFGGPGCGSGDRDWEFEDDDDYNLSGFPLGLLVLYLGAVTSAGGARGGGHVALPISKRMKWFRKHGNARLVLGFPISAWMGLVLGIAAAAAALLRRSHKQPDTDPAVATHPLQLEKSENESLCADHREQHSLLPEHSEKENLTPALTAVESDALVLAEMVQDISTADETESAHNACDSPPALTEDPTESSVLVACSTRGSPDSEHSTEYSATECFDSQARRSFAASEAEAERTEPSEHSSMHEVDATESVSREFVTEMSDTEVVSSVDTVEVSQEVSEKRQPFSAAEHITPGRRFWKHKSFGPSLSRVFNAVDDDHSDVDNTSYSEAHSFWKQQAATTRACSKPPGDRPTVPLPLDMSVEAVAARARAARSCSFATNQRPQVPRLHPAPASRPSTPSSTTSTSTQNLPQHSHCEATDVSEQPEVPRLSEFKLKFDPSGAAKDLSHCTDHSDSWTSSFPSLRKAWSLHHRTSSSSALASPGTPDASFCGPWEERPHGHHNDNAPACLNTIASVCEDNDDSGLLTCSTGVSEWTLSEGGSVADDDSDCETLSCDGKAEDELEYNQAAVAGVHPLANCALHAGVLETHAADDSMHADCSDTAHACGKYDDATDSSTSSVCGMDVGMEALTLCPTEDTEILCTASSKSMHAELNDESSHHTSLSLSTEALVHRCWEPSNADAPDCKVRGSHGVVHSAADAAEDTELAAERELLGIFAKDSNMHAAHLEQRAHVSTRPPHMHEQELADYELVQASAACMLEQPLQCHAGSYYVNPLPLLTVDHTPVVSPRALCAQQMVSSPVASETSSMCSEYAELSVHDAAMEPLPQRVTFEQLSFERRNSSEGACHACDQSSAFGRETEGCDACKLSVHMKEDGRSRESFREDEASGDDSAVEYNKMTPRSHEQGERERDRDTAAEDDEAVTVGLDMCGGQQLFSQLVTLHALSGTTSPDNTRSRTVSALNTSASSSRKSEREERGAVDQDDVFAACSGVAPTCVDAAKAPDASAGSRLNSEDGGSSQYSADSNGTANFLSFPSHCNGL